MNEIPLGPPTGRSLLLRIAIIPLVALLNFAISLFDMTMTSGAARRPVPPLLRLFLVHALPAVAWVALSIPVQLAARRLMRTRISIAVAAHIVIAAGFVISHSVLTVLLRVAVRLTHPDIPISGQVEQLIIGFLPLNLLVYAALVAGTLAWDNWQVSIRQEQAAADLAAELTRAELAALRSKMQPHFLFNTLHGISSVMDTDVVLARRMMAALSTLLRSSLSVVGDYVPLQQELHFTRDYLELQHMRFEERLRYDLQVDANPHVRVPSFILQPLVENAVVHGMADRAEPTWVRVAVRELPGELEIDVSDNGLGFPDGILNGTKPPGVGLGALRARLLAIPSGGGTMTLRNRPDGGAQVILRVATHDGDSSNG